MNNINGSHPTIGHTVNSPQARVADTRLHPQSERRTHTDQKVTAESQKRALFVAGANGQMGRKLMLKGLEQDHKVIACTRKPLADRIEPIIPSIASEETMTSASFWYEEIAKHAEGHKEIQIVNLIGASVAPKGKSLEDINVKPVIAMRDAAEEFAKHNPGTKISFAHFSSICASIMPKNAHMYSDMRREVDEELNRSKIHTVVFRPGLIFNDMQKGNLVDMGHAYSPEQFATLPFQPVLGSGNQIQQPVYEGDIHDAILNSICVEENLIVDAVGPKSMTQSQMFEFFVKLKGGKFRKISIPYAFAKPIAEHFPKGRIAPYSIAAFEELEKEEQVALPTEPFEKLVGHQLTSMDEIYKSNDLEKIIFAKPPIIQHFKEAISKMIENPKAIKDSLSVARHAPIIANEIIKAAINS